MKISELLNEQQEAEEVQRVGPTEVVVKDRESGIETKIPKRPNQPGTIQRDEEGNLVLDRESPGEVVDNIEPGDKIITKTSGTQGSQGTIGTR